MKLRWVFFFSFLLALLGKSFAQPGERGVIVKADTNIVKGNTYAIIVGISDYKLVPHLQFAHKDAQAFEKFLLSDAGGKIPQANVETFLNENATRSNVGDAISVVARKAKPGDRVYFFFAGHGDMEDLTQIENGLLLLYNSPNGNYFGMNDDVLEILDLKRYLSPLAQRGVEMIFIVDACHSGNLKGGVEGVAQTASAMASSWGKEYKILSCQPNQISLESAEWGGGRGLFSLVLEEGMKGLADKNNDGKVSFAELQRYITDNVSSFSEDKQIPMVNGDLSKPFVTVNPDILAALKKQKSQNYPILAVANAKGNEEKYVDSLDKEGKKIYFSFKKNLEDKKLIWPKDTNALKDYRAFIKKYQDNPLVPSMRRNLAASLNERFNNIVAPLLKDETSFSSREECSFAAAELDSCMQVLGEQHYMYDNIKARKLFMNAMSLTWALAKWEYNVGQNPTLEKSISLMEESEALEPNAAYTLSQLGELYCYLYEYDKAAIRFQKYLDLRPNDFWSKYSLASLYKKLKQYDKAEELFNKLIAQKREPLMVRSQLFELYAAEGKYKDALACAYKIRDSLDRFSGLFAIGLFYARASNMDSAVYYYQQAKAIAKYPAICDNNIGQMYFVNHKIDSARRYFNMSLEADTTNPFPMYNLANLDFNRGEYRSAINGYIKSIGYAQTFSSTEAFVTHIDLHFGKRYTVTDSSLFREFSNTAFQFDLQYAGYLSILYCLLRDPQHSGNIKGIEYILNQMFTFKDEDVFTWFHHACYKALKNDKAAALESIEKSLKLGFGNYFMLTSDDDLSLIRDTPEFKALLAKYFPDQPKKK